MAIIFNSDMLTYRAMLMKENTTKFAYPEWFFSSENIVPLHISVTFVHTNGK